MVSTEYIRQQIGHFRDGIAAYGLGDLYEDELAVFEECLAYREGYDPQERLPENTCDVVVDVVIMDSPSGEIIEHQLGYWFDGKWRTFDSDGAEAVLSDGYRVTRWYPLPGGER